MTDKERDDALIAEAERLATKATQSTTKSLAWIEECQSALIHLERSNWRPAPKPDRAEVLKPCPFCGKKLNVYSEHQGFYHDTGDCPLAGFEMARDGYSEARWNRRAEREAEQEVVPRDVAESWKARADNLKEDRENLLSNLAIMMSKHVENWPEPRRFSTAIALIDKTLTEALTKREAERPAVVVPDDVRAWALHWSDSKSKAGVLSRFILSLDGAKGGE